MQGNVSIDEVVNRLQQTDSSHQFLRARDFDLTNATANERSLIASYEAELPIAFREDAMRLVFVLAEEFTTDGTGGNTETFSLSNNLLEQTNTTDLVLVQADGTRVYADSIDYANDSFDYTDSGTGTTINAFYVARNPVRIDFEKSAPRSQGGMSEVVYDDVTSILHERDQNSEPPRMDFEGDHPLTPVVPRKWTVEIYAEGPVPIAWDDSDTSTDDGVSAVNPLIKIPINRATDDVQGLAGAVRHEVTEFDPSV